MSRHRIQLYSIGDCRGCNLICARTGGTDDCCHMGSFHMERIQGCRQRHQRPAFRHVRILYSRTRPHHTLGRKLTTAGRLQKHGYVQGTPDKKRCVLHVFFYLKKFKSVSKFAGYGYMHKRQTYCMGRNVQRPAIL